MLIGKKSSLQISRVLNGKNWWLMGQENDE